MGRRRAEATPSAVPSEAGRPADQPTRRVFVSYSHDDDDPAHKQRVLDLANRLRNPGGIGVILDRYVEHIPNDWALWASKEIPSAHMVLVICTPKFFEKYNAERGGYAAWECKVIRDVRVVHPEKPVVAAYMNAAHAKACRIWGLDGHYPIDTKEGEARLLHVLRGEPTVARPPVDRGDGAPARTGTQPAGRTVDTSEQAGPPATEHAAQRSEEQLAANQRAAIAAAARRAIAACDRECGYTAVLRTLGKLVDGLRPSTPPGDGTVEDRWLAWIAGATAYDHVELIRRVAEADRKAFLLREQDDSSRALLRDDGRVMRRLCFELLPLLPGPLLGSRGETVAPAACSRRLAELAAAAHRLRPAEFRLSKVRRELFSPWEVPPQGDFGIDEDHRLLAEGLVRHIEFILGLDVTSGSSSGAGRRSPPDARELGRLRAALRQRINFPRPERQPLFFTLDGRPHVDSPVEVGQQLASRIRSTIPELDLVAVGGGTGGTAPPTDRDYDLEADLKELILIWEELDA